MTKYLLLIVSLGLFGLAVAHVYRNGGESSLAPPPREPVRSPYESAVAATGVVEPAGGTIELGSDVAGLVTEVQVEPGQTVEENQPLVRFDDRQLQAQLAVRQAAVAVAQASLARIESSPRTAEIAAAEARLQEAEARLHTSEDSLMRIEKLHARQSATEQEVVADRDRVRLGAAQVAQANAGLELLIEGASEPQRQEARAP